MRYARTLLAALALLACSEAQAPALPLAPLPAIADHMFRGMAVDASGACIPGAKAVIVRGQGAGQSAAQTTPCALWEWEGGFVLQKLLPSVAVTIQLSAPGYTSQELTVVPNANPGSQWGIEVFTLASE